MDTNYLIYFREKPYYIVANLSEDLRKLAHTAGTIIVNQPNTQIVGQTIRDIQAAGTHAVILLTNETGYWWTFFCSQFVPVTAGGGIVFNKKKELLFIFRRKKWDLPKGKLDEGETIETCALREVQEETGLVNVALGACFDTTYHVYDDWGEVVLKKTVWFLMEAGENQTLIPQTEEDIEEIKWLGKKDWHQVKANTFPSIRWLLQQLDGG